jgi:hypothetical protein
MAMRIEAVANAAEAARAPRVAVATMARELMYRANWDADEWIGPNDVRNGSKLGAALLKLGGLSLMSSRTLNELVTRYAGADQRIGSAERTHLLDDIEQITRDIPTPQQPGRWEPNPPTGVLVRWLLGRADVDFDGRVTRADTKLGSEWAMSMLDLAKGVRSLDMAGIEHLARTRVPHDDPAVSVKLLATTLRSDVARRTNEAQQVLSLARASVSVFDADQDLRLSAHDGKSAAVTIKLLGTPHDHATVADIAEMLARFDVSSLDGSQQPDGRLDRTEYSAYLAARRSVGE